MKTCAFIVLVFAILAGPVGAAPNVKAAARQIAARNEKLWKQIASEPPAPGLDIQTLFSYALVLCEADVHLDRLERIADLAARMQFLKRGSYDDGNFFWYYRQRQVVDRNAGTFAMRGGSLLWLRDRDRIPEPARTKLRQVLEHATDGLITRRVRPAYTNIAIMRAADLILLGESLDRPDAVVRGKRGLGEVCLDIDRRGIAEYDSPTYFGVDLLSLQALATFARDKQARRQADALLKLFWSDIAANFFTPSRRLAGAQSRTYSNLVGGGALDEQLIDASWLDGKLSYKIGSIFERLTRRGVPASAAALLHAPMPRLVRMRWGPLPTQTKTHRIHPDVSLSISGACYANVDMPLTVDLPGGRQRPRGYFIADGRGDPYGRKRILEPASGHEKPLHLDPAWTGTQRGDDALGLVVYDTRRDGPTVMSHFVFPSDVKLWLGDRAVTLKPGGSMEVDGTRPLVIRDGTAAVGVRVVMARNADGSAAPITLVRDAEEPRAMRLTITHDNRAPGGARAALWVRVGSELDDAGFGAWRKAFAAAASKVRGSGVSVEGVEGPLRIRGDPTTPAGITLEPTPTDAVLEVNGQVIGRAMLAEVEPIRSYRRALATAPLPVAASGPTFIEAENGFVPTLSMGVIDDPAASGGKAVMSLPHSTPGGLALTMPLEVAKPGRYPLWGRVIAPDGKSDSFVVEVTDAHDRPLISPGIWQLRITKRWQWQRVTLEKQSALELPAGRVYLKLYYREPGSRVDRFVLTRDAAFTPNLAEEARQRSE